MIVVDYFDFENESGVRKDTISVAFAPERSLWRTSQFYKRAHLHMGYSLVPAAQNVFITDCELEGFAPLPRRIKYVSFL